MHVIVYFIDNDEKERNKKRPSSNAPASAAITLVHAGDDLVLLQQAPVSRREAAFRDFPPEPFVGIDRVAQ